MGADREEGGKTPPGGLAPIVLAADLAGTAVFAMEGALAAARAGLDLLGIAVVAFVTALGGGILRDVLLGAVPPASLRDQRYALAVLAGAVAALFWRGRTGPAAEEMLLVLDAAGLALFAVAGTEKALGLGSNGLTAIMLGTMTATGGGAVRDMLLGQIPRVLRVDFYASAALAASVLLVVLRRAGISVRVAAFAGLCCCLGLRLLGAGLHWRLPALG